MADSPFPDTQHSFWEICVITNHNIPWSLAAFFEKHMPFSRCLFQLETTLIFDFFGKELFLLQNTILLEVLQHSCWIVWKYMPFSKCLLQLLGNAWLLDMKYNSVLGNVYIYNYTYIYINTFVWKNCFITIRIVPWSVAAILLKNGCLFQEVWFRWECNISQNIYFDLGEFI